MDNFERTKKSSQRKKPEEKNGLVDSHKTKWTANRSPSPKGMGSSKNGDRPHLPHDDRSGQPVVADVDLGETRDDPPNREPIEEVPAPPVGHTSRPQRKTTADELIKANIYNQLYSHHFESESRGGSGNHPVTLSIDRPEQKNTRPPRGPSSPSRSNPIKNIQDYSQDRKKPGAPREHEQVHKITVSVDDTLSDMPKLLKSPQEPTRGSDDEGSPTKRGSNYSETKQRSNSEGLTPTRDELESLKSDTITVYTPHSKENRIEEATADKMKDFGIQPKADPTSVRESDGATGTSSSSDQNPQNNPKTINILLLDETGVGKTTFINSLVNILSHKTLESILTAETRVLVDAAFTLSDENHQIHRVKVRSNFDLEQKTQEESTTSHL